MSSKARAFITLGFAIATILFNIFSQAPFPLNGQTSRDIANRFDPNYFLPANYVFSIWGVIYTVVLIYGIYQALPAHRDNRLLDSIRPWFWLSCVSNMVWLVLFHFNQFALSTVAMVVLLVSLVVMYLRLRQPNGLTNRGYWAVSVAMSIYFGWITVATVANFTYVFLDLGWDGFGIAAETWGAVMVVVGGLIALGIAYFNRDLAYGGVIIWAFVGIFARHQAVAVVGLPSLLMAALVAAGVALAYWMHQRSSSPTRMALS